MEIKDDAGLSGVATWGSHDPNRFPTIEALIMAIDTGALVPEGQRENKINVNLLSTFSQWLTGTPNTGSTTSPFPNVLKLGSGTAAPSRTDVGLTTPINGTTKVSSIITPYTITNNYYARWVFNYTTADPTFTANEGGLFDSNGLIHSHWLFTPALVKATGGAWVDYKILLAGN